jgi:DNA-binding NtrC family response regulator
MRLFGDRFLLDGNGAIDLATGERVRLTIEEAPARAEIRERDVACSELTGIWHPLLVPLVDFGLAENGWFEAQACAPPLGVTRDESRQAALHLVRFLLARGIAFSGRMAGRHVRPAVDAASHGWRPIGVRLIWRRSLDQARLVMEAHGPPGVTRLTVCGPRGSGLRTARTILARAARLAGFVPIDRRVAHWMRGDPVLAGLRHLCVLDWLTGERTLPSALSIAAAASTRRHLWIRFCREDPSDAATMPLEALTRAEMKTMIYQDAESGPGIDAVEAAIEHADGLPGLLIDSLTSARATRSGAMYVHEVAPDYLSARQPPPEAAIPHRRGDAGIARLERVVEAARALVGRGRHARAERLLRRASEALAARGAGDRGASAACDLGELYLARGRPAHAREAFARARTLTDDPRAVRRTLLGTGCAWRDEARFIEAEAPLRAVMAAEPTGAPDLEARRILADVLLRRDEVDTAWQVLAPIAEAGGRKAETGGGRPEDGKTPGGSADARTLAVLSEVHRRRGDFVAAGRAASEAVRAASPRDHAACCEAQVAVLRSHAALGNVDEVRRCADRAMRAARGTRSPVMRVCTAAYVCVALAACGEPPPRTDVERLLRAASKLPRAHADHLRKVLIRTDHADTPVPWRSAVDLLESFTDLVHDACSETAALAGIAKRLADLLGAASVRIDMASPRRTVACAGREWPDQRLASRVIDGGAAEFRDGIAPEAVEPVRAGGATVGCIAIRWVAGGPPSRERVREVLRMAAAAAAPLIRELEPRRSVLPPGPHPDDLLGCGATADRLREEIRRAALAPYPVLIEGESGSGKELAARAIHVHSARRARRFCAVNCAALTEDLLEAELFGHVRGAFTGAMTERAGLFEEADGGTLLLDEVGELSPRAQAKLLRVLQEGEVRRVGESLSRKVDARIVAATNRRLAQEVEAGRFRADLRFRLDVLRVQIPPLRERPEEVAGLAERIWSEAAARVGTRASLSPELLAALARYDWPGNVRELQNVMAALAVDAPRRGRVPASLLPPHVANLATRSPVDFDAARLEFERRFVRAALARAGGRKHAAAAQLGVSRQGLAKMMKRLGITER